MFLNTLVTENNFDNGKSLFFFKAADKFAVRCWSTPKFEFKLVPRSIYHLNENISRQSSPSIACNQCSTVLAMPWRNKNIWALQTNIVQELVIHRKGSIRTLALVSDQETYWGAEITNSSIHGDCYFAQRSSIHSRPFVLS